MSLPTILTDATQSHLDALIADAAPENQHRDYKRELPKNWDNEAKKRFIADLIAMANASGGDVIYGVDEDDDAGAKAVVPQVFSSGVDEEVRRLQDFAMEYAEPRIPGVQVHPVAVTVAETRGHAIVIPSTMSPEAFDEPSSRAMGASVAAFVRTLSESAIRCSQVAPFAARRWASGRPTCAAR